MKEKLEVHEFDQVLLKDGRRATITDAFEGKLFFADIGEDESTWENITITIDDIEKVTVPFKMPPEVKKP